jgi:hypothetical protein
VPSDVAVNIHAYTQNCNFHFYVDAKLDVQVGPCLETIIPITGGGNPNVTPANFCKLVTGFWNEGKLGGTCLPVDLDDPHPAGLVYTNPECLQAHERQHFNDLKLLLNKKVASLSTLPSMTSMPYTWHGQTCADAIAARKAAIIEDVKLLYEDAAETMSAQGEAAAAAAARSCQTETAKSICQWAQDDPFNDVDLCKTCSDGSLGKVYTDPE